MVVSVVQDNLKPREDEKTEKNRVAKKNFATLNACISETARLRKLVFVAFNSGYDGLLYRSKVIHGGSKNFFWTKIFF